MGDSISEGTIQEFVKQVGEFVAADEVVAVIETDKVNVEIRSPNAGVIKQFFAAEGDEISVSANFFELDPDATGGQAAPKKEEAAPQKLELLLIVLERNPKHRKPQSSKRRQSNKKPPNLRPHPPHLLSKRLPSKKLERLPQKSQELELRSEYQ